MKRLAGISILIADDNALTLEALKRLLELSGATVLAVENGEQVLTQLHISPNRFDVLLIDINMPVMDGLAATKKIRQDRRFDELPIIAATADHLPEDQLNYYQIGMNGHLAKPISLHKLCEAILAVLDKQPTELDKAVTCPGSLSDSDLKQQVLERFGHNQELVINLIPLYAQEFIQQFDVLKSTKDINQIGTALHALKGISGTIGANDVYNYVNTFHESVKKNQLHDAQLAKMLETLPKLHASNLQRLQNLFVPTENNLPSQETRESKLQPQQRKKIIQFLQQNDLTIIQYVDKLQQQYPNENELITVKKYIDQLKFEPALNFLLNQSGHGQQGKTNDK
ncbi:response regulator [Aliiglaciecola sp. 2_MG-2023]|uniref:response regulator n=1 Tax=unclassified Aliiglaciecola TaxID=2593648 RepID=UPI0026E24768|nr:MULTISPECIES: response regulator [unclassified Aliiglaciecola]MDO6710186.1 response regulator [Aliiglaciecola sp. 2_MG-2023]MDO6751334.1 response regulator [Aliiglaciecola sp. 1_MG-2023]